MQTPVRDLARTEAHGATVAAGPHRVEAVPETAAVDLAVIVPAYNEIAGIERTLALVHDVLATFERTSEVAV